jgi:hypothetical protein
MTRIDFGCAIEGGSFDVSYDDGGVDPALCTSSGSMTLMTFFLKLVARLQRMGTVPAMDIDRYLAAIEGET